MTLNGIVLHKFELLGKNTRKLKGLLPISVKDLRGDFFLKKGIERTLQVSIEAMIDAANRLCSLEEQPPATSSFNALKQLEDLGFIEDAEYYRDMIRFRNFVVHRYENVRDEVIVDILRNHLDDFNRFINELKSNG
jgi:uncharacterized protein YutE (UPF0331/DUF86 family)